MRASQTMLRRTRTAAVVTGTTVVLLAAAHLALTPVVVPWLAERALERFAASSDGRAVQFDTALFDPFTLQLTIIDLAGVEPEPRVTYAAERVTIDFAARTLVQARPVLDALSIAGPAVELDLRTSGAAHVLGMLRRMLARVAVAELTLTDGTLAELPSAVPATASWRLDRVGAHARTLPAQSAIRFTIAAEDTAGVALDIEGTFDGRAATGRMQARNVDLGRIARRFDLGLEASAGVLDAAAAFEFPLAASTVRLVDGRLSARNVALVPRLLVTITAPVIEGSFEASVPLTSDRVVHIALDLAEGSVAFADGRIDPPARLDFDGGELALDARANTFSIVGRPTGGGGVEYLMQPEAQSANARRLVVRYDDVPAAALDAYARLALGAAARAGTVDARLVLDESSGRIDVAAHHLELGADAPPAIAMALALLEDPSGVVALEGPLVRRLDESTPAAVAAGLRAQLEDIAADPHVALGALVDRTGTALQAIEFAPGAASLSALGSESIAALGAALALRPKIGVAVAGRYDPAVDRRALAARQVELHVLLATAGPSGVSGRGERANAGQIDFAAPLAQDVLAEFARERLSAETVATLRSLFNLDAGAPADAPARVAYYRALFDALVAAESIADAALVRLGRYRARTIADALAAQGIAAQRITVMDTTMPVDGGAAPVRVPIVLTPQLDAAAVARYLRSDVWAAHTSPATHGAAPDDYASVARERYAAELIRFDRRLQLIRKWIFRRFQCRLAPRIALIDQIDRLRRAGLRS